MAGAINTISATVNVAAFSSPPEQTVQDDAPSTSTPPVDAAPLASGRVSLGDSTLSSLVGEQSNQTSSLMAAIATQLPWPTDMRGNPLAADKVGAPGRNPLNPNPNAVNADYDNNLTKLHGLASIVLDTSGAYSDDDKLDAYNATFRMAVTGQMLGFGPDESKLWDQLVRSPTGQAVSSAQQAYGYAVEAAVQRAEASGQSVGEAVGRASLQHWDSLSAAGQRLLFSGINPPDYTGSSRYANPTDWRTQMLALAKTTDGNSASTAKAANDKGASRALQTLQGVLDQIRKVQADAVTSTSDPVGVNIRVGEPMTLVFA